MRLALATFSSFPFRTDACQKTRSQSQFWPITSMKSASRATLAAILFLISGLAWSEEQSTDAKFQSTYVWQGKPGFRSGYRGANSLSPEPEQSYTWTVTAYLGWRPWANGELYFNPEGIQGRPLSNVTGLGGLTNAELQKSASSQIRFYRARLFYRHTVGLNDAVGAGRRGAREDIESDQNQLAGTVDRRRFVLTVGNLSITDMFGTSEITGDGRTQFLNWSSLNHGHFDYAADARGFSWGIAGELFWDDWTLRAGRFMQPKQSNGLKIDYRIMKRYGDQLEVERRHQWNGQPGTVKAFAFRNVGWGVSFEQSLSDDVRVLVRGGAHDGKTESYAFTEIDRSLFAAASIKGARWGRAQDTVGVAYAVNGLSGDHRRFLAAGGQGFFLGDGRLNYGHERVFETYYNLEPAKGFGITLDWQHITHPGYNRDRGPVNIGSVRLHAEF